MYVYCAAIGCGNTTDISNKPAAQIELEKVVKITFHLFPSDPVRRVEWIRILRLENKTINTLSRLCSLHFEEKYIDRTSLAFVRLKRYAIPHIFENKYDQMDTDETDKLSNSLSKDGTTDLKMPEVPKYLNTRVETKILKCDNSTNTTVSLLPEKRKSTLDKETRISPERIWSMNFSNMEEIRKASGTEIKYLRKRIQTLKRQLCRKKKKIDIMKNILGELSK